MRRFLIAGGSLLAVLVVAVIAAPFLLPLEMFKEDISALVEDATGRTFNVDGKLSLSLLPDVAFEMSDVKLGNAKGFGDDNMVELSSLKVKVSTMALLKGKVQLEELVLERPVLNLGVNAKGDGNWVFAPSQAVSAKADKTFEESAGARPASNDVGSTALPDINLGNVKIVDATLKYSDFGAATKQSVEHFNATFKLANLSTPLSINSDFSWNGQKFTTDLVLDSIDSIISAKPSKLDFKLTSKSVSANGGVELTVDLSKPVPSLLANIDIDNIEVHSGLIPSARKIETSGSSVAAAQLAPPPAKPSAAKAKSGKLFELSKAQLDLSGLKAANADLDLSIGHIAINDIKAGPVDLAATLKDGKLDFDLKKLALYGGNISSKIKLDASNDNAAIKPSLNIKGLRYHELLEDLGILVQVGAELSTDLNLTTNGKSVHDLVSKLKGKGNILVDKAGIIRVDPKTYLTGLAGDWGEKLGDFISDKSFEALKGRNGRLKIPLVFSNGNVSVPGLDLKGPVVHADGKGKAGLINQRLDFRIVPMLVASAEGADAEEGLRGVRVPFFVKGSFAKPEIKIDEEALAREIAKQGIKAGVHYAIQSEMQRRFGFSVGTNEFTDNLVDGFAETVSGGGGKKTGSGNSSISKTVDDIGNKIGNLFSSDDKKKNNNNSDPISAIKNIFGN